MLKIFSTPALRKRILFALFVILLFRFLAHIPVPGVDVAAVKSFLSGNTLLGLFNLFSGGGFANFSIVTLGLSPYITASIIIQLFTMMIPQFEELSKEGETGREKLNQYTKYLTVPLSFVQAYGVYFLLGKQQGIIGTLDSMSLMVFIFTLTGGAMLLTWLGDLVTEYGIGQGISLLIFISIVSALPSSLATFFVSLNTYDLMNVLLFLAIAALVIVGVVLINEGTRNVPLEYGRRDTGSWRVSNYMPIKVNQAGVIPIIFAVSLILLPSFVAAPLAATSVPYMQKLGDFLLTNFSSQAPLFNVVYFLLVFGFTYFYTTVQFDPAKVSDDIKKRGGFIPGIRPGLSTQKYLDFVVKRLTFVGAVFLGLVAIFPNLAQAGDLGSGSIFSVSGTSILITVSVVLETINKRSSKNG